MDGQSPSSTAVSGMRGTKKKIQGRNSTMICLNTFSIGLASTARSKRRKPMGNCIGDFQSCALSGQRWSAFLSSSRTYVGCPPLKATIWTEILSGNRPMGWGGGEEEEEAVGQFRSGGAHFFPVSPAAAMQAHYVEQEHTPVSLPPSELKKLLSLPFFPRIVDDRGLMLSPTSYLHSSCRPFYPGNIP